MQIVIVDDNRVNVALLKALARQLGGAQRRFHRPGAGAAVVPDPRLLTLLLLDYMMPVVDGPSFIGSCAAHPGKADVPILMITASHEAQVRYDALARRASDFLTKPVDRPEFLARARNMLALRRSQKALAERAATLAEEVGAPPASSPSASTTPSCGCRARPNTATPRPVCIWCAWRCIRG